MNRPLKRAKRKAGKVTTYYITHVNTNTILAVYGTALLDEARAKLALYKSVKGDDYVSLRVRFGLRQHVGESLKRGSKEVQS